MALYKSVYYYYYYFDAGTQFTRNEKITIIIIIISGRSTVTYSLEDVASSTQMLALMHSKAAEKRTCRSCLFVTCTALLAVA